VRELGASLRAYAGGGSLVLVRTVGKVGVYAACGRAAALLGPVGAAAYNLCFQLGTATTQARGPGRAGPGYTRVDRGAGYSEPRRDQTGDQTGTRRETSRGTRGTVSYKRVRCTGRDRAASCTAP
jgi:hypothetical protein